MKKINHMVLPTTYLEECYSKTQVPRLGCRKGQKPNHIVLSNDVPGVLGTTILVKLTTTERKTTLGILPRASKICESR